MESRHDPYASFRLPNFRLYAIGSLLALIGTGGQNLAIRWEVYERTGNALSLGLVGLAQAIPMFALVLFSGYLADRFDRRKLVMCSLLGAAATSVGLAVTSYQHGPLVVMYGLLMLDAAVITIGRPARTALLPQLVPRELFENAVTWRTSIFHVGGMVGPALGGFILAWSVPATYLLSAGARLAFIVILAMIRLAPLERSSDISTWDSILAGVRFVRKARLILVLMSLDMFAVLLGGAVYLLPIFATDILAVGKPGLGWLQAAPAAGAFCMAIILAHAPAMRKAGRSLLLAVAGFGVATIVFGLSKSMWLSMTALFFTGAFDNISMVIRGTLIQMLTPDKMRGRVSAVGSVFVGSSNQLGGFESGLVAAIFGPVISVVSGGVGCIMVVLATALASPRLRRFGAMKDARPIEVEDPNPDDSERRAHSAGPSDE